MTLSRVISAEDSQKTVLNILKSRFFVSTRLLRRLKAENMIVVNGSIVRVDHRLSENDVLSIDIECANSPPQTILPEDISLDVIYEDNCIIAVNKPPGMVVHPTGTHITGTVANALAYRFLDRAAGVSRQPVLGSGANAGTNADMKAGANVNTDADTNAGANAGTNASANADTNAGANVGVNTGTNAGMDTDRHSWFSCGIHPVSRLDRDTSGVVLFAKNSHIAHMFHNMHRNHEIKKEYVGIVEGVPEPANGEINLPIEREPGSIMLRKVSDAGKTSQTLYKTVDVNKAGTEAHMLFYPVTGRTHQIRLHAREIGCPLISDDLYGTGKRPDIISRHALHSFRTLFPHPLTLEPIIVSAPIPADMQDAAKKLGLNQPIMCTDNYECS